MWPGLGLRKVYYMFGTPGPGRYLKIRRAFCDRISGTRVGFRGPTMGGRRGSQGVSCLG